MIKTIIAGNTTLTVSNIYPFCYNGGYGKEVLRMEIERINHGYTDIESALESPAGDILYKEDGELMNAYKGYTRDFKCSYENGVYSVEIARVSQLELEVEALRGEVAELRAAQGV